MAKINIYDYEKIHNINEKRVWNLLIKLVEEDDTICTCRDCILDIVAITLNNIPPHYQINEENYSEAYKKITEQEIYEQLLIATRIVKTHPHHL
jgi:competence protein ComFB